MEHSQVRQRRAVCEPRRASDHVFQTAVSGTRATPPANPAGFFNDACVGSIFSATMPMASVIGGTTGPVIEDVTPQLKNEAEDEYPESNIGPGHVCAPSEQEQSQENQPHEHRKTPLGCLGWRALSPKWRRRPHDRQGDHANRKTVSTVTAVTLWKMLARLR